MRVYPAHLLLAGILLLAGCADEPVPPSRAHASAAPSHKPALSDMDPDDAAIRALLQANPNLVLTDLDLPATRAHLRQRVRFADLNGDGVDEGLYLIGQYIRADGSGADVDTGQNRTWTLVRMLPDGTWRSMLTHEGTDPVVLDTGTNGWRDISSAWWAESGELIPRTLRFTGKTYHALRASPVGTLRSGSPKDLMRTVPVPPDVLREILAERLPGVSPSQVDTVRAAAYVADLDDDGRLELLVLLDAVRVGRKVIYLAHHGSGPANLFFYIRKQDRWQRVFTARSLDAVTIHSDTRTRPPSIHIRVKKHNPVYESWVVSGDRATANDS